MVPEGCTAPAKLEVVVDAWMGSIECRPGPSILVFGSVMSGGACPRSGGVIRRGTPLFTAKGHRLEVCSSERKRADNGKVVRELVVGLGGTELIAEVRTPADAAMLLYIASTLTSEK